MKNKIFTDVFSKRKARSEENALLRKMESGFTNREFKMYLQFIVDNKTKKIASAEALSRWETASGEVLFPGSFIGLMEKSGLIINFDYYMFEKVCSKLSEWKDTDLDTLTISCNITRITISENDFAKRIQQIAERYDFDRSKLLIEITEDSIEKNVEVARNNIVSMKALGFRIALDDIGRGYTSLMSLCEYPIDVVKIDRDFLLLTDEKKGKRFISWNHFFNS